MEGNSLAVQWLGLGAFTAEGTGSIPGWGTKKLQAVVRPKINKYIKIKSFGEARHVYRKREPHKSAFNKMPK